MKCIMYITFSTKPLVERVTNDMAIHLVAHGVARYVPKHVWKAYRGATE